MTQEDKDLLFKDLCARLPYGVNVEYNNCACELLSINKDNEELTIWKSFGYKPDVKLEEVKTYLFPMSSMNEEQEEEYNNLNCYELGCFPHTEEALDYLIANHFDYRGLIDMGLALDATDKNIY